jgi:hypothetical protein
MNSLEKNAHEKNKRRVFPLLFLSGGILLTGGLIALTLLNCEMNDQMKTLMQKLYSAEINYNRRNDSLSREIMQVTVSFNTMSTERNALKDKLAKEQARNSRLIYVNTEYTIREKKCKNDFDTLKETFEKITSENVTLKAEAGSSGYWIANLQVQKDDCDNQNAGQSAGIDNLVTRKPSDASPTTVHFDSIRFENVSEFYTITELNCAYGLFSRGAPYSYYFLGINSINGYMIDRHIFTGLGFGFSFYDAGWMAPVYLDFRYNFKERKYTPYIFADGGFMFDLENFKLPSSLFMNPGFGFIRRINNQLSLNMGAGLFVQRINVRSSFINVKLGFMF